MNTELIKKKILDLAIRGKLVEQRPEEGTAEELYAQIQEEKKKLIAEGKIKKEKPLPEITEEEIPFDIPESWKWIRLGDCVSKTIKRGKSPKYTEKSGTLVFAQKCNSKYEGIRLDLALYLDESVLSKYDSTEYMVDKDIVINSTGGGTMGRVGIYKNSDNPNKLPVVPDSHVTVIRSNNLIDSIYLFYFIKNNQTSLESLGDGSTNQTELKPDTLKELIVPLPPLSEQKRIVDKVEEIFSKIDVIEKAKADLANDGNLLEKKILDLAISGKLVEHRPEEGTAEELYAQIQEEKKKLIADGKIKKEKPLPEITEDEIPFDIPTSWKWVRFQNISKIVTDYVANGSFATLKNNVKTYSEKKYAYYVRTVDFATDFKKDCSFVDKASFDFLDKSRLFGGELILPNIGGSIGKTFIMPKLDLPMTLAPNSIMIDFFNKITNKFYYYLFSSNYGQKLLLKNTGGSATPKFSKTDLRNMNVPLPPLAEQKRIVAKIEELLPYCDMLK